MGLADSHFLSLFLNFYFVNSALVQKFYELLDVANVHIDSTPQISLFGPAQSQVIAKSTTSKELKSPVFDRDISSAVTSQRLVGVNLLYAFDVLAGTRIYFQRFAFVDE